MNMAKGFGIAGLVLAILAIVVPIVGIAISGIAIVCAIVAALASDRVFATAIPLIAGINTFFLSASVWVVMGQQSQAQNWSFTLFVLAWVAAPFVAMALNATGKVVLDKKEQAQRYSEREA
jgi:hypothetical protein